MLLVLAGNGQLSAQREAQSDGNFQRDDYMPGQCGVNSFADHLEQQTQCLFAANVTDLPPAFQHGEAYSFRCACLVTALSDHLLACLRYSS